MLLLLLALEGTVHYSCWDNFTIIDWTRYSSKQDTNTSLKGKQMQTSTQLWGSRDISLSMLDLRKIKSLETKVKPRVVTHAHQMAAKCQHHTPFRLDCVHKKVISFFLIATIPGDTVHLIPCLYLHNPWSLFSFLKKEVCLPHLILNFCCCFEPFPPLPFLGSQTTARGSKSIGVE